MTNTQRAELIEVNEETSVCECCGKSNLKRVAVIRLTNGNIVRYGSDCAAKELGRKMKVDIESLVEIKAYVAKWSAKYTPEIVVRGVENKLGFIATLKSGIVNIHGVGKIDISEYFEVYQQTVSWWAA